MTLAQIAERIRAHLTRFERDETINRERKGRLRPYYNVNAFASGRYVGVTYISFQNATYLSKSEASLYLAKLNEGFIGRHFEALR